MAKLWLTKARYELRYSAMDDDDDDSPTMTMAPPKTMAAKAPIDGIQ